MTTNKRAQKCEDCGALVMPGKGILTNEWSNYADDTVWVVRHSDKSICQTAKVEQAQEQANNEMISNGINYIKSHGTRSDIVTDGSQVVYDGRRGYNQVGWLLTRTDGTLYLTSRNNLDGWNMSETYVYSGSKMRVDDLLWTMNLI